MDFHYSDLSAIDFINISDKQKDFILDVRNHPEIRKWMFSQEKISREEHYEFCESLNNDGRRAFYMVLENMEEFIGVVNMSQIDPINRHAYLGIYANLESPIRHKGNKLMGVLQRIAFEEINLRTLKLEVFESNKKAIAFYQKHGFEQEGCLKEFYQRNEVWENVIIMGKKNPYI